MVLLFDERIFEMTAQQPEDRIKNPYTLAEIKTKIASNDYNAEMLLQHAMLLLDGAALSANVGEPAAQQGAGWWRQRADEIELEVAQGKSSAMRCYTDMRALLQAAAAPKPAPAAVAGPSDSEIDALVASIGPTEGIRKDSRDLTMDKLRVLVRRALATWAHVKVAPAAQGDVEDAAPSQKEGL